MRRRALAPIEQSIAAWRSAVQARDAYGRIKNQLAALPEDEESMELPRPKGEVRVEQLTYLHPNQPEPVLRGVSFSLAPGEVLGAFGPNG
ncbi:MAG: type I secretion system permease/ATPase, partial [Gammaproteobacteria bacterium]